MSHTFKWCKDKTKLAIWDKQVFCINRFGNKYWCLNGEIYRENGPAVEWTGGTKFWYVNGVYYSESGYWKEMKK